MRRDPGTDVIHSPLGDRALHIMCPQDKVRLDGRAMYVASVSQQLSSVGSHSESNC